MSPSSDQLSPRRSVTSPPGRKRSSQLAPPDRRLLPPRSSRRSARPPRPAPRRCGRGRSPARRSRSASSSAPSTQTAAARPLGPTASSWSTATSSLGCSTSQRSPSAATMSSGSVTCDCAWSETTITPFGLEERVHPAVGVDELLERVVGERDRGRALLGPVAVGVVVGVGEREEQEVVEVVLDQVAGDAGRVGVADVRPGERRRAVRPSARSRARRRRARPVPRPRGGTWRPRRTS